MSRDADATRGRILEAAKVLFSHSSYEGVGVREIGARAQVDPALVIRYFGSKSGLFRAVAQEAFDSENVLAGGIDALPDRAARLLTGAIHAEAWRTGYDPLRLLLCSAGSATAGPILGEYLEKDFLEPLARALAGSRPRERAVMLGAHIVGFALMRIATGAQAPLKRGRLRRLLEESLRATVGAKRPGS
jgi:AcrR family transcriptional regulator